MNIVINNVDFWDTFEPMKYWTPPKSYDMKKWQKEVREYMLSGDFCGSIKVDGFWCMIIKDNEGKFHMRSRTANVEKTYLDKVEWIPWIIGDLEKLPNGTVLIGEVYKPNDEGSRKITSILNCLKDKALVRQEKAPLHFYCFDCLAFDKKTYLDTPIEKRIKIIDEKVAPLIKNSYVEIAKYLEGKELLEACYKALEEGREGMVIQQKVAKYTCGKRTARLSIKIKKEIRQTIDAFLDGTYKLPTRLYNGKEIATWSYWENVKTNERVNKNKYFEYCHGEPWEPITKAYYYGWAAAVSFSVMRDGKPFHIGYISGITDELKEGIVKETVKWKGKVAELSAMEVEKLNGGYSLRHGKIVSWREDKKAEDCDFSQIA